MTNLVVEIGIDENPVHNDVGDPRRIVFLYHLTTIGSDDLFPSGNSLLAKGAIADDEHDTADETVLRSRWTSVAHVPMESRQLEGSGVWDRRWCVDVWLLWLWRLMM